MSNPGKRGEIEDVLSAIRRLLAEDTSGDAQAAVRAAGERLILTQEQRSVERSEGSGEAGPSIEDALAALEAAVAARATPLRAVEQPEPEDVREEEEQVEEAPFIAIDELDSVASETVSFRQGAMRRFQLVRTSFSSANEYGEEDKGEPQRVLEAARPPGVEEVPEPQPAEVPVEPPEENPAVPPVEDPVEEPSELPPDLPEEAPEDPPEEVPDEMAALPEESEAYLPAEVRDDIDACGIPEAVAPVGEVDTEDGDEDDLAQQDDDWDDDGETLFAEEAPILDPEALRLMVAEILREELQGPLGERMTRNVRKLVRSEIRRAFAGRELE